MTEYTKEIICLDKNVHAAALGPMPNGLYGIYIGTFNFSPSGFQRPYVLLTTDGIFDTPEEAEQQGNSVIEQIRTGTGEFAN